MSQYDYTKMDYSDALVAARAFISADPAKSAIYTDVSPGGMGDLLLTMIAFGTDQLSSYLESAVNEVFLPTAVLDTSKLLRAKSEGYPIPGPVPGSIDVLLDIGTASAVDLRLPSFSLTVESVKWSYAEGETLTAGNQTKTITMVQGTYVQRSQYGTGEAYQKIQLTSSKVADGTISAQVDGAAWTKVDSTGIYGPTSEVFEIYRTEDGYPVIQFGTGVSGKAPIDDQLITVTYLSTDGADGKAGVGAFDDLTHSWTALEDGNIYTGTFSNTAASTGSTDSPDGDTVAANLLEWKRSVDSAVTGPSFIATVLAYTDPVYGKVTKAFPKLMSATMAGNMIRLYVATAADQYTLTTVPAALQASLLAYLEDLKCITTIIDIENSTLITTNLTIKAKMLTGVNETVVKQNIESAMKTQFDVDHISLGTDVYLSDLYAALENIKGVDWTIITSHSDNITADDDEALQLGTVTTTIQD